MKIYNKNNYKNLNFEFKLKISKIIILEILFINDLYKN